MKSFLHIGCGQRHQGDTTRGFNTPEWREIRFDIDPSVQPDIVGTMLDMSAVADESVDAIFSSHNIEHLYAHEVQIALLEFRRVLKPSGFLVLTCPDLQSVAQLIAEDKLTDVAYTSSAGPVAPIDILYGYRPMLAAGHLYMAHKCGFTLKALVGTLMANGFQDMASMSRGYAPFFDLWAVATKIPVSEEVVRQLAAEHFPG
jgi:ubiquinone/menaquinone biosynthesis C-methylase UbiE